MGSKLQDDVLFGIAAGLRQLEREFEVLVGLGLQCTGHLISAGHVTEAPKPRDPKRATTLWALVSGTSYGTPKPIKRLGPGSCRGFLAGSIGVFEGVQRVEGLRGRGRLWGF